jgi:hypothetical protein
MTDFAQPEAKLFAAALFKGGKAAALARQAVSIAALRHHPEWRQAVDQDCRAIAKSAAAARGFADLSDLTAAGYAQDFALHQTEIIAAERRQTAKRSAA